MELTPKIKEKIWSPTIEKAILEKWEDEYCKFNPSTNKKIFVIDTPPPYPSGRPWHIGAAAHYSQIDMIARTVRMSGFEVLLPIGIDRNGLPVEIYTEKKFNVKARKTERDKFLELCRNALDDLENEMIQIMRKMGMSGDLKNYYRTDSEQYRSLTQATFIELWNKGEIYQSLRPNNYCIDCGTTIADAEVVYEEIPTELVQIRFKIKDSDEYIVIATTRPELICSCQTIIVNPEDERYTNLIGKIVITPIYNTEVKLQSHPSARREFGSGAVMICSYGDYTDVVLFRELNLKEIIAIDSNGCMTANAGKYNGIKVKEARAKIIEHLENECLVEKKETIIHRTPTCERSRTSIEIIPMQEYYIKQINTKLIVKKLAEEIIFYPDTRRKILLDWIDSITLDWPISRRRYYGTEVPIWYCKKCAEPHLPQPGKYYQPWKDPAPFDTCKKCGEKEFVGDERTFDTWMDSSISPLYVTRYLYDEEFFRKTYPITLRPQAKDIIRTWLYYTILRCYQLTGKSPFGHAWIMGYGVDEKGERMSKSKGNVIDPIPILERYGADTFRYWAASEASLGSDFRCSENRISGSKNFLTKLWNISRFISSFPVPEGNSINLTSSDKWVLAEVSKLIEESKKGYRDFNFFIPATKVREFTWNIFAANYLEMVKARAYGTNFTESEQQSAWHTLHIVLRSILLLLAPIIPFVTDYIWRELYGQSIHKEMFPMAIWSTESAIHSEKLLEFNSRIWNDKKNKGLSLKEQIDIEIPDNIKEFSKDLIAMHNIKSEIV
ncbi:MAG TPA: valine--tRNA ligase [Nitrososphaerales archaeon]